MKTGSRPILERENPAFRKKNGDGAMKRKALRIMAGLIAEKRIAITLANSGRCARLGRFGGKRHKGQVPDLS